MNFAAAQIILLTLLSSSVASGFEPQIVGGTPVGNPDISAATVLVDGDCTGFMIAPNFALTARHCAVANGASVLLKNGTCVVTTVFDAPNSDPTCFVDDVTLLELNCPAGLSDQLKVFELPEQNEDDQGSVQIAGYGKVDGTGVNYPGLFSIQAQLTETYDQIRQESSNEIANWLPDFLTNAEAGLYICMTEEPGHVEFHGDSGGPTYVTTSTGFKALGINSFSLYDNTISGTEVTMIYGACGPRLSHYTNWIQETMAGTSDPL